MPDIREYTEVELEALRDWTLDTWTAVRDQYRQLEDVPQELVDLLEVEEVIVGGEAGRGVLRESDEPLRLAYVVSTKEESPASQSEQFNQIASDIVSVVESQEVISEMPGVEFPPTFVTQDFGDISATVIPNDLFEEAINNLVQIREDDPNRAYSLTRDENIIIQDQDIVRVPEGAWLDFEESESPVGTTLSIQEYPDLDGLRANIINAFRSAKERTEEEFPDQDIDSIALERVVFIGEFASGTAEEGVDPFSITIFASVGGVVVRESRVLGSMTDKVLESIVVTDTMKEWASGVDINGVLTEDGFENHIEMNIDPDSGLAYDIYNDTLSRLVPGEIAAFEVEEVDAGLIGDVTEEPEDEEPEPEEPEEPDFPGIEPELRQFATDENTIQIPINKDTKRVEPRPLYDFERELLTPGEADTSIEGTLEGGIGEAIKKGRLGTSSKQGDAMPPSTFPRVGNYIKWNLFFRGPSFPLQLHRDLVVYSGYISTIYEGRYVVGSYESLREYIYRLKEVGKRDLGPVLIRQLSQQQAAARGLSVTPELPSGQPAPWLERRNYYEVVEESMDSPAWENPKNFLYPEEDE